jgi:hypothetical protein
MEIFHHPACTHNLVAPSDMQDGSCEALPVMYEETPHGVFAVSFWKPTADELKSLNSGSAIALGVRAVGRQHPVVWLSTTKDPV